MSDEYCTAEIVKIREEASSYCIDEDCDLSGGYAHAGPCEACECGRRHAIAECPERPMGRPLHTTRFGTMVVNHNSDWSGQARFYDAGTGVEAWIDGQTFLKLAQKIAEK